MIKLIAGIVFLIMFIFADDCRYRGIILAIAVILDAIIEMIIKNKGK